jgi:hypothetical protein
MKIKQKYHRVTFHFYFPMPINKKRRLMFVEAKILRQFFFSVVFFFFSIHRFSSQPFYFCLSIFIRFSMKIDSKIHCPTETRQRQDGEDGRKPKTPSEAAQAAGLVCTEVHSPDDTYSTAELNRG